MKQIAKEPLDLNNPQNYFTIDQTLGRDVKIVVDFIPVDKKEAQVTLQLNSSYGEIIQEVTSISGSNTVMLQNLTLEVFSCFKLPILIMFHLGILL